VSWVFVEAKFQPFGNASDDELQILCAVSCQYFAQGDQTLLQSFWKFSWVGKDQIVDTTKESELSIYLFIDDMGQDYVNATTATKATTR
jgi:hypothetical protein